MWSHEHVEDHIENDDEITIVYVRLFLINNGCLEIHPLLQIIVNLEPLNTD